jgi:hypothetical protein
MTTPEKTTAERRADITAAIQAETGIDEAMIDTLVRNFYARIREDDILAPIFNARITDWEPHLQRMCAFWSSVALLSGRYHGQPMQKHLPLPAVAVRDHRTRIVLAEGGQSFHRARASGGGKPGTRHCRFERRDASQRRAFPPGVSRRGRQRLDEAAPVATERGVR